MRHGGKAMDAQSPNLDNGARVGQYTHNGNAWQQWQFQDAGSGCWRIISRHGGKRRGTDGRDGLATLLHEPAQRTP